MTVFVVEAVEVVDRDTSHLAGVATSYTGAVDLAWKDAQARRDTFDSYVITGVELDTPGIGLHNTYFPRSACPRSDMDVEWFRDSWETLAGFKVPYEDPRRILPEDS